jgi:2-dehydro-3-deoxy-L-rhamnonate dehydrogenase (NAD+)
MRLRTCGRGRPVRTFAGRRIAGGMKSCMEEWQVSAMQNRTAVVTGALSGIGQAAVERLRSDGVTVITLDLNDGADYPLDVSDAAAVVAAAASIGPVDILVNSAGIGRIGKPVWETPNEDWAAQIAVNLTGTFLTCKAFTPGMIDKGWGRIVNIASMAGKEGNAFSGAYSASKAGVIALTKSLGKELATTGVLANAIAPGVIETPMNKTASEEDIAVLAAKIPMGRMGRPGEVSELIAYLSSDKVSFSTGFTYDLSGGRATY